MKGQASYMKYAVITCAAIVFVCGMYISHHVFKFQLQSGRVSVCRHEGQASYRKSAVITCVAAIVVVCGMYISHRVFKLQLQSGKLIDNRQENSLVNSPHNIPPRPTANRQKNSPGDSSQSILPRPTDYNQTRLILYNKAPKCYSTTVVDVLQRFGITKYDRSACFQFPNPFLPLQQRKFATILTSLSRKKPYVFFSHFPFVDFQKFGFPTPTYIQVLRDPVEQRMSQYHYSIDRGWVHQEETNMTIHECMQNISACPHLHVMLHSTKNLPYFYGPTNDTWDAGVSLTNKAKKHIVEHFSVVGITEEFQDFFEVLQYLHPQFFEGIPLFVKCYMKKANPSKAKKVWPDYVKDFLRESLIADHELYKFSRARFHRQMQVVKAHRDMQGTVVKNCSSVKPRPNTKEINRLTNLIKAFIYN